MTSLQTRLGALSTERIQSIRRGIEKESLRTLPTGGLALTPHPASLGSALTHPKITTDFSESQVELITGIHPDAESCLAELTEIHQFTYRSLRDAGNVRRLSFSMPRRMPWMRSVESAPRRVCKLVMSCASESQ